MFLWGESAARLTNSPQETEIRPFQEATISRPMLRRRMAVHIRCDERSSTIHSVSVSRHRTGNLELIDPEDPRVIGILRSRLGLSQTRRVF